MSSDTTTVQPKNQGAAISNEERYKFVTSQCVYCNEKLIQSFTLFLKMVSTLAGGVIWLRLQPNWSVIWSKIDSLAVWLLVLLGLGTILMIYRYLAAWWGFRKAESELTGGVVRAPRFPRSCMVEISLIIIVAVTTCGGVRFLLQMQ